MLLPAVCLLLAGWRLLAAWRLQLEEPEQRAQLARLGCSGSSLGDTLHLGCGRRCAAALAFPMLRPEAGIAAAAAMAALPDVLPDHAVSRRASRWLAPGAGEGVMSRTELDFFGVRISRLSETDTRK